MRSSPLSNSLSRIEVDVAKVALINREQKRRDVVKKFAARRAELIASINDSKLSAEDRFAARFWSIYTRKFEIVISIS